MNKNLTIISDYINHVYLDVIAIRAQDQDNETLYKLYLVMDGYNSLYKDIWETIFYLIILNKTDHNYNAIHYKLRLYVYEYPRIKKVTEDLALIINYARGELHNIDPVLDVIYNELTILFNNINNKMMQYTYNTTSPTPSRPP